MKDMKTLPPAILDILPKWKDIVEQVDAAAGTAPDLRDIIQTNRNAITMLETLERKGDKGEDLWSQRPEHFGGDKTMSPAQTALRDSRNQIHNLAQAMRLHTDRKPRIENSDTLRWKLLPMITVISREIIARAPESADVGVTPRSNFTNCLPDREDDNPRLLSFADAAKAKSERSRS
jgi:hypothetical protein